MSVVNKQLGTSGRKFSRTNELYNARRWRNYSWWIWRNEDYKRSATDVATVSVLKVLEDNAMFTLWFRIGNRKFQFDTSGKRGDVYIKMYHCILYACSTTFRPWHCWLEVKAGDGVKDETWMMQSYVRMYILSLEPDERVKFHTKYMYDRGPKVDSETGNMILLPLPTSDEMTQAFQNIIDGGDPPEPQHEDNYVVASPSRVTLGSGGGTASITVKANVSWSITGANSWCKVQPSSGTMTGSSGVAVNITLGEHTGYDDRTLSLTLSGQQGVASKSITVKQTGKSVPSLTVSPATLTHDYTAGSKTIKVHSNVRWIVDSYPSWVTLNRTSGENNGDIKVTFQENGGD